MYRAASFLFIGVFLVFMGGCGSQSSVSTTTPSNPSPADVPVTLSVTDTPPAGVTVLFFQLSITGASLSPGNISLLSSANPIPVNVSQLQTDSAFLGSANLPAGTYNSLTLYFANPQLTIFNGSGATIGSGANACATNTVCTLQPSANPLTLTFSTAPFPVTLTANSPLNFLLDIHLDRVIQPDLSVNLGVTNGVTILQLSGTPKQHLGHLIGTIQSIASSAFTLQTGWGKTFTVDVDSNTTYNNFPSSSVCSTSAEAFSCLAMQQVVKVEVSQQTDGTLLASEVDYLQAAGQTAVEGNIISLSTSGGNTLMDLILQQGASTAAPGVLPFGQRATVTVPSTGVTYAVDSGGFTIPGGLTFATSTDLVVGQEVSVVVQGSVTTSSSGSSTLWGRPAAITFTTNSITLEPSQITGLVSALNASGLNFNLSTLPNYFVPPAATAGAAPTLTPFQITVLTTGDTTFTSFTPDSISGMAVNDVVSVGGWLFLAPTNNNVCLPLVGCGVYPTIAAQSVVGRLGATPLF